jgi:hypothetical protein
MANPVPVPAGRPYETPKIYRVRIAGDEMAVAGCKTSSAGSGPNPGGCTKSFCKNAGS